MKDNWKFHAHEHHLYHNEQFGGCNWWLYKGRNIPGPSPPPPQEKGSKLNFANFVRKSVGTPKLTGRGNDVWFCSLIAPLEMFETVLQQTKYWMDIYTSKAVSWVIQEASFEGLFSFWFRCLKQPMNSHYAWWYFTALLTASKESARYSCDSSDDMLQKFLWCRDSLGIATWEYSWCKNTLHRAQTLHRDRNFSATISVWSVRSTLPGPATTMWQSTLWSWKLRITIKHIFAATFE